MIRSVSAIAAGFLFLLSPALALAQTSAAPAGSRSVGLACFDRAELEQALQRFDDGISGLIAEGDADAVGLNVARSWASGIRGGMSLGSPAKSQP